MWRLLGFMRKIWQAARHIQGHVLLPFERLLERLIENNYAAARDEVKSWGTYAELEAKLGEVLAKYGVPTELVPAAMDDLLPVGLEWLDGIIPEEQIEPIVEVLRKL